MKNPLEPSSTGMLKGMLSNAATGSQSNLKEYGELPFTPAPPCRLGRVLAAAAREREDAAFYE